MGRSSLTVLFQPPFWVGIYERTEEEGYQVCRIVFGAEPRDWEVYAFLLEKWQTLSFSPALEAAEQPDPPPRNPKRLQREICRQTEACRGVGTRAQQALSLQREQGKEASRRRAREDREAERERQAALRREKKRAKHRGR